MVNDVIAVDDENKIKIRPELMTKEVLYPFIHDDNVFLFYKDNDEMINCYEIVDSEIKKRILDNRSNIIKILEDSSL